MTEIRIDGYGRAGAVIEFAERPWAVMPSTLAAITDTLRRHSLSGATDREAAPMRSGRDGRRTAGAVAVLPLRGVITPRPSFLAMLFGGGGGLETFRADFREAVDDDDVASILIDVDSPGGLVDLVPETAAEILGARGTKPIVAIANTRAASAAYWIAAAADEMVVTPSGEVGSIGVYMAHEDWSKFNEDFGVATTYVAAGKFKTEGNPDEPLSDAAKAHWQKLVNEPYNLFVKAVAAGRGVSEAKVREGYGQGRVLPAAMALSEGMVDSVETFEQVVSRLVAGGATSSAAPAATAAATAVDDGDAAVMDAEAIVAAAARTSRVTDTLEQTPDAASSEAPPDSREDLAADPVLADWLIFPTPRRH